MTACSIPLSQVKHTSVDTGDFQSLSCHKWYYTAYGYAARNAIINGKKTIVYMHRVILNAPAGMDVDHIDGDRLNNSRTNLRLCTRANNLRNVKPRNGCTSKYKGVNWLPANKKWRARIRHEGHDYPLGCFVNEEDAAKAYNEAAHRYFGPFAQLNIIS